MTTTHHTDPEARTSFRAPGWVRPKTVFLAVLLVVLVFYTEMAFELDWRTTAGRIGPGFFPRIVGAASLLITAWSLVAAIRDPEAEDEVVALEDEVGDADFGKHPKLLTIMVVAMVAFTATLVSLGAIVSTAAFLILMLTLLNRGRTVLNVCIAVALPLGMYLLFQSLLNAGLPEGILPRF